MAGKTVAEPPVAGDTSREDANLWNRFKSEIDYASKDAAYVSWLQRCDQIVKRYRDERTRASLKIRKFNVLWSNVQTLKPLIFSRAPKPVVERRFQDRDPAARLASQILERCLSFQVESSKFYNHVDKSVEDYLLAGLGQTWIRYEPSFEAVEEQTENAAVTPSPSDPDYNNKIDEAGDGETYEKLAYETLCVDYVFYRDFLWGNARTWPEVPWVARRKWLTKSEIEEEYGAEKAAKVVLDFTPPFMSNNDVQDDKTVSYFKKAEVWELWNKADRKVYEIPTGTPGLILNVKDDPLKLEDFWPCPEPIFATQTSDTVVPVPDYYEYQDQAQELDDLTNRISMLVTAVRANGVYDASQKGVERLLSEGVDNKLIPVDNWATFQEKGGSAGVISLVPMQEIMSVLSELYVARQNVLNDLYQVTGLSDLVRGMGDPNETATAQRIKGQFASNRLQARQELVAIFCRDILRIMAEMIAEIFSDETLLEMSGIGIQFRDDVRKAQQEVPLPAPPQPQPGMPPQAMQILQMQAQQQYQMQVQQVGQQKQQELMAQFQEALRILRDDKLRGFRVEIETDSTIQPDADQAKAAATELYTAFLQGLQNAAPVLMQAPEMFDPLEQLFMYVFRTYRVGRSAEASVEEAFDKMRQRLEKQAGNPPPNPEQIKAQAEQQKIQAQLQADQQRNQMEMQAKQADFQLEQQRNAMKLESDRQQVEIEKIKAANEIELEQQRMAIETQKLALQERSLNLKAAADEVTAGIKVSSAREMAKLRQQNAQRPSQNGASG